MFASLEKSYCGKQGEIVYARIGFMKGGDMPENLMHNISMRDACT
jgi:hypothetical protein